MKNKTDIVLINPNNKKQIYQDLSNDVTAIENPVWMGMIAQYLTENKHYVETIDANAFDLNEEDVAEQINNIKPLLVAVIIYGHNPNASTHLMSSARKTCNAIKNKTPEQKILLIGGHVAALPYRTLEEENVDAVCTGEGFITASELINYLKSNNEFDPIKVPGILYKNKNNNIIQTNYCKLIPEVPQIKWELFDMTKYRAHNWHCFDDLSKRQPYASIYTTLGCPFNCHYCCIQAPFRTGETLDNMTRNSYRYQSPQNVMKQIDILVNKYGVRNIKIADELFILNKKHVSEICNGILERKYNLNIWAYARIDTINARMLDLLKKSGINWICLGYESGNSEVRKSVNKEIQTNKMFDVTEQVKNAGINIIGNFMFGLPEDNSTTMQDTLKMSFEMNCEYVNFYTVMAYPGSKLYEQAIKDKLIDPNANWDSYSQYSKISAPLPTKYLTGSEVLKFRDEAWIKYFSNTKYLKLIENKFGKSAIEHINKIKSIEIKRQ